MVSSRAWSNPVSHMSNPVRHMVLIGAVNTYSPDAAMSSAELYVCQSAVLLANDINTKLLCGLRGGMVVIFEVTSDRRSKCP